MKTSMNILIFLVCSAISLRALAKESPDNGFWGEFAGGWASTKLDYSISSIQSAELGSMSLVGGYHWGKQFYMALDIGGLGIEYSNVNDPSKGAGISPYLLVMRYYAASDGPYFLQVGAGKSHYWTNRVSETGGWGKALNVGMGWDMSVNGFDLGNITPSINYYSGDFESTLIPSATQKVNYHSVSFSIGLTFR